LYYLNICVLFFNVLHICVHLKFKEQVWAYKLGKSTF